MPYKIGEKLYNQDVKLMFIDESGHHNLDPKTSDPHYPIFVLCGCIFDENYYQKVAEKKFSEFKKKFFGTDDIILHTREMTRPSKTKERRFDKLADPNFRIKFYDELNKFLEELDFTLVACAIKKPNNLEEYGLAALDPYLLSFNHLLTPFTLEIPESKQGRILAEKRNGELDNQLELAWLNIKINGTQFLTGSDIKDKVDNLSLIPKSANQAGLQIVDLVAGSIGRNVLKIKSKPSHEVRYSVVKKKFSKKKNDKEELGLIILPK